MTRGFGVLGPTHHRNRHQQRYRSRGSTDRTHRVTTSPPWRRWARPTSAHEMNVSESIPLEVQASTRCRAPASARHQHPSCESTTVDRPRDQSPPLRRPSSSPPPLPPAYSPPPASSPPPWSCRRRPSCLLAFRGRRCSLRLARPAGRQCVLRSRPLALLRGPRDRALLLQILQ